VRTCSTRKIDKDPKEKNNITNRWCVYNLIITKKRTSNSTLYSVQNSSEIIHVTKIYYDINI